jgi:hypothetical protein
MKIGEKYSLHKAIKNKTLEQIIELIAQKEDVNGLDEYGNTPLGLLLSLNDQNPDSWKTIIAIAKRLLVAGANPNQVTHAHTSPLWYAIQVENIELVDLLLKYHADVNRMGEATQSPLTLAIDKGYDNIVRLLLINKADPTLPDNTKEKRTPLDYAIDEALDGRDRSLNNLLSHPDINPDDEETQKQIVDTVMRRSLLTLLFTYDEVFYSNEEDLTFEEGDFEEDDLDFEKERNLEVTKVLRLFVLAGFNLRQNSSYYSEKELQRNQCIEKIRVELKEELELKGLVNSLYHIVQDKEVFSSIMKGKYYGFIENIIKEAEVSKQEEAWKLGALQEYPILKKQFLLASNQEKEDFLLLSTLDAVRINLDNNKVSEEYVFFSLLFDLPPEIYQDILQYVFKGEHKALLFSKAASVAFEKVEENRLNLAPAVRRTC